MPDDSKPKPPRPEVFPPPLPGAFREPFPKAKSDPPLTDTPAPESIRMRSTPPDGTPLPRRNAEQSHTGPLEDTIRELRLTNVLLREKLTAAVSLTLPSPVPPTPPPVSKSMQAAKATVAFGKWTTIVMGVLGLAATIAHQFRPDLEGPIQFFIKLLGGQP